MHRGQVEQALWRNAVGAGAAGNAAAGQSCVCGAWRGELGLEPTVARYVENISAVFAELERVIKPTGSLFLNLGDSYCSNSFGYQRGAGYSERQPSVRAQPLSRMKTTWMRPKQLLLVPARVAIAMQERGWILRNDIVWHKPNALPSSVKDRLTNTYEHIFHFVRSRHYFYGLDAIREPHKRGSPQAERDYERMLAGRRIHAGKWASDRDSAGGHVQKAFTSGSCRGKNPGDVWSLTTRAFRGPHFAVYPESICERPIKATCPPGGIVLDLFAGSGTTLVVAKRLGRRFLGCDLNADYVRLANERITRVSSPSGPMS
jgi:site-specific DNA-methyltransferase (cytosine-N4-specific)